MMMGVVDVNHTYSIILINNNTTIFLWLGSGNLPHVCSAFVYLIGCESCNGM